MTPQELQASVDWHAKLCRPLTVDDCDMASLTHGNLERLLVAAQTVITYMRTEDIDCSDLEAALAAVLGGKP